MAVSLGAFAAFAASQIATPGPANMAMLSTGAAYGFRAALPFVTGVVLGKQLIIWPTRVGQCVEIPPLRLLGVDRMNASSKHAPLMNIARRCDCYRMLPHAGLAVNRDKARASKGIHDVMDVARTAKKSFRQAQAVSWRLVQPRRLGPPISLLK